MTSRQQTSLKKSSKPYLINTRTTKREIDSKPIYNMIENSAESPSNSADDQPGSPGNQPMKNHFLLTKIVLFQNLILNCRLCGHTMWIAG